MLSSTRSSKRKLTSVSSVAVAAAIVKDGFSTTSPPKKKRRASIATDDPGETDRIADSILVSSVKTPEGESSSSQAIFERLEQETMGKSWYDVLSSEFSKPYFRKLKDFILTENESQTIYPSVRNIYSWSRLTPLPSVKVVVIGQDPYHDVNQAHGLAFSVLSPTKPPPSLRNIYKQIHADYPTFIIPRTGDLTPLAKLGVLFLNSSLTVRAHKANSHSKKGWEQLTTAALKAVAHREDAHVVFLAWGAPAQATCKAVGIDETRHLVLKSPHPSPLSAYRGFLGNEHFKKANEWLVEKYGPDGGIDWTALRD